MSITNYLNKIKTAVYGRDVRGAIHDAIKECYDDASVNNDNANMEVKMARGTHNTLNDRLDKSDEIQAQTNAQLSNIDNKMATKEELGVERKRIDNFTTLSEGSTTGDAELIDGRIGDDGVTYANIGDSIRCQNRKIKNGALNDGSIKLNVINDNVIGNKYRFKGEMTSPCVTYDFKNTTLKASDVKQVKVKFKFKNLGERKEGVLFFHIEKKGWWGYDVLLPTINFGDLEKNKIYTLEAESDFSTTEESILDVIKIGFYRNVLTEFDFYLYDIELYINGNRIFNVEYSKDNTNVINESKNISFLADKEELNAINNKVIGMKSEIEILKQYDALSKSSLRRITCWGDSITEGGSAGLPWASVLQNLIGNHVTVNNKGKSGQCSGNIAFRQGAKPLKVGQSFTIPDSLEEVIFKMENEECRNFRMEAQMDCEIEGIRGSFQLYYDHDTVSYTAGFTRKEPGSSVSVEKDSLIMTVDDIYRDDTIIIWIGRNDIAFCWPYQIDGVIENVRLMVEHLSPDIKRFLVVSVITSCGEMRDTGIYTEQYSWITEINKRLKEIYPNNFVDAQTYLSSQCIYDAGITPTEEDLFQMQHGTMPKSLSTDGIHPDEKAKECIAKYLMYNELDKRGWIL